MFRHHYVEETWNASTWVPLERPCCRKVRLEVLPDQYRCRWDGRWLCIRVRCRERGPRTRGNSSWWVLTSASFLGLYRGKLKKKTEMSLYDQQNNKLNPGSLVHEVCWVWATVKAMLVVSEQIFGLWIIGQRTCGSYSLPCFSFSALVNGMHVDVVGGEGLKFPQHGRGRAGGNFHGHFFSSGPRDVRELVVLHGARSGSPRRPHGSLGFVGHGQGLRGRRRCKTRTDSIWDFPQRWEKMRTWKPNVKTRQAKSKQSVSITPAFSQNSHRWNFPFVCFELCVCDGTMERVHASASIPDNIRLLLRAALHACLRLKRRRCSPCRDQLTFST